MSRPTVPIQSLHGLSLRNGPVITGASTKPVGLELTFELGRPQRPQFTGELPRLAERTWPGGGYVISGNDARLFVEFTRAAAFDVDLRGQTIAANIISDEGHRLLPLFLSGTVLSAVLGVQGAAVFHGSAVEVGGRAIAFVGHAGAGKSTSAALLCAAGARMVTDDAARVDRAGDALVVHRGPAEVRLRANSAGLASTAWGTASTTADDRTGVLVAAPQSDLIELGAIVLPGWHGHADAPSVRRLSQREALERLLRFPRIGGWRLARPNRAYFEMCATAVAHVPVAEALLPRDLSTPDLPDLLISALAKAGMTVP